MNQRFIRDTKPEIGACQRCGLVVMVSHVNGFKTVVDALSLTVDDYRQAIIDNRQTYTLIERDGKLFRLRLRTPLTAWTNDAYVVRDHGCGPGPATIVQAVCAVPPQAPVTAGKPKDGHHQPAAPDKAAQGQTDPNPAPPVNRPPSNRIRCGKCGTRIWDDQPHTAASHGSKTYFAYHADPADCAGTAYDTLLQQRDYDALSSMPYETRRRPIDDVPLPEDLP
ncbi:hypothetical protein [Streptomyces sp. NPDC057686]|uniref:hypothetical protein n=1 Tax=Streptomyces sp. NPDC057686 TaxID=3346212 RepID=UPI00368C56D2